MKETKEEWMGMEKMGKQKWGMIRIFLNNCSHAVQLQNINQNAERVFFIISGQTQWFTTAI